MKFRPLPTPKLVPTRKGWSITVRGKVIHRVREYRLAEDFLNGWREEAAKIKDIMTRKAS